MWEDKAADMLRVIQLNTLEDRSVHDKYHWDSAIKFLEHSLNEKLAANDLNLREQVGQLLKAFWLRTILGNEWLMETVNVYKNQSLIVLFL